MTKKYFIEFIIMLLAAVVQRSFVWGLPKPLSYVNIILIMLVFMTVLGKGRQIAYIAGAAGFFLDIYSFLPFGANIAACLFAAAAVQFFGESLLTNRSLYSVAALTVIAVLFYGLMVEIIFAALAPDQPVAGDFLSLIIAPSAANAAASGLLFYAVNFASRRLKPVFIIKSRLKY